MNNQWRCAWGVQTRVHREPEFLARNLWHDTSIVAVGELPERSIRAAAEEEKEKQRVRRIAYETLRSPFDCFGLSALNH